MRYDVMIRSSLFTILIAMFFASPLLSQVDYYYLTGTKEKELDTLARETTEKVVKESSGLFEREIDPESYILGPEDEFSISILSAEPKVFTAKISPDGLMLIKGVGVVNLKDKTLAEGKEIIKKKIRETFNTDDVFILLKDIRRFKVTVSGTVPKQNIVPATAVDRVSEAIERAGGYKHNSSLRNIVLLRKGGERKKIDLVKYFLLGDEEANPYLLGGDHILLVPLNERNSLSIKGAVNNKGVFEYVDGDSLSTLIKFGQGFQEEAFLDSVEYVTFDLDQNEIIRQYLDLNSWRDIMTHKGELPGDFPLKANDRVYVRVDQNWPKTSYAVILGEVKYPGYYAVGNYSTRVSDLISLAGGFTENASIENIEYIRQKDFDEKDTEMERLWRTPPSEMSVSEKQYFQARKMEKRGKMAVNFAQVLENTNSDDNIFVLNKDSIIVPQKKDYINIVGRVNNPGRVIFKKGMTYLEYINIAGGYAYRADENETLIVKPSGAQFLAKDMNYVLEPGDNILVPPKQDVSFMEALTTTLTIVSQLVTIAGVVIAVMNTGR